MSDGPFSALTDAKLQAAYDELFEKWKDLVVRHYHSLIPAIEKDLHKLAQEIKRRGKS